MAVVDSNKVKVVTLAEKSYAVKVVPMARVLSIEGVIVDAVTAAKQEIDLKEAVENPKTVIRFVLERVVTLPHALLSLFIDDLPLEIFTDEKNGVTFPDFLDAFHVALELNRVDTLKNVFSRLGKTLIEAQKAQASISKRTS